MIRMSASASVLMLLSLSAQDTVEAQVTEQQLLSVEFSNFEFSPNTLTFEHGRTYRLHLTNTSSGGHDFTAPEFFAGSTIDKGDRQFVVDGKNSAECRPERRYYTDPARTGNIQTPLFTLHAQRVRNARNNHR